jgi:cell division protein FtsQ
LRGQPRQRSKEADEFSAGKRDERERRHESRAFRDRALAIGAVVLVVVGLVAWIAVYRSQAFAVVNVTVSGNSRLTEARVLEIAGMPPGTTLLRVPTDPMAARLAADPWIASAKVERVWPDTLRIVVQERVPLAAVLLPDKSQWLVDARGTFIGPRSALPRNAVLPLIRDVPSLPASPTAGLDARNPQLANAVAVLAGLGADLRTTIRSVSARTVDETAVFTASGLEILFGAARQMDKKDFLARRILTDQKGKVVFIDVRTVERPVWRGLGK